MPPKEFMTTAAYEPSPRSVSPAMPSFTDKKEEKLCRKIIESLTAEELEEAGNTSFAYFISKEKNNSHRAIIAFRLARKHLLAEQLDLERAKLSLKNALKFRKERRVNDIRLAFHQPSDITPENKKLYKSFRKQLTSELSKQEAFVRGFDYQNRAIIVKKERTKTDADEESYVNTSLYMTERAIACTEYASRGKHDQVIVIEDYANYYQSNFPAISLMKESLGIIERNYPDAFAQIFLLDVPFYFRGIWYVLKPFLNPATVHRVQFVTGEQQKKDLLSPLISKDQAMPLIRPDGKLTSSVDMSLFLNGPFYCDYENINGV